MLLTTVKFINIIIYHRNRHLRQTHDIKIWSRASPGETFAAICITVYMFMLFNGTKQ